MQIPISREIRGRFSGIFCPKPLLEKAVSSGEILRGFPSSRFEFTGQVSIMIIMVLDSLGAWQKERERGKVGGCLKLTDMTKLFLARIFRIQWSKRQAKMMSMNSWLWEKYYFIPRFVVSNFFPKTLNELTNLVVFPHGIFFQSF